MAPWKPPPPKASSVLSACQAPLTPSQLCSLCEKKVYPTEERYVDGQLFHVAWRAAARSLLLRLRLTLHGKQFSL